MSSHRTWLRRASATVVAAGLALTLAACDSGGSDRSGAGTTTTSKKKPHRPTTTSSSTAASTSSTTGTPGTTAPTLPPTTAPPATASCGAQAATISSVVYGGDLQAVPLDSYTISDCRLAPSQPIWAAIVLTPKPGQTVPQLTVVLERLGSIWTVHSSGPGATGCDAPVPVPSELRLGC
jgi:hypothetical protein